MTGVIIHIGPHKSGTSALQRFFFDNQDELYDRDLVYRLFGKNTVNHHQLAVRFRPDRNRPGAEKFIARTLDEHIGKRTVLFSSEMFCEFGFDQAGFMKLFEGVPVRVIAYIRNPCDQVVNAYNQVVRSETSRWTTPVNQKPRAYDVSYRSVFDAWMDQPSFTLCPYDPPQWVGGTIFSDFLDTIGVPFEGLQVPVERENVSLPSSLIEVVRAANVAGLDDVSREQLIALLRQGTAAPQEGYPLSDKACQECIAKLQARLPLYREKYRPQMVDDFLLANPAIP